MQSQNIGISWQLSDRHGWGIFGTHLALHLIKGPRPPVIFTEPSFIGISEEISNKILSYLVVPEQTALDHTTMLHSLGNDFQENKISKHLRGRKNVAFAFFENEIKDQTVIERVKFWDRLLVGSSWNRDVCLDLGISNVAFVSQGVDTKQFYPGPKQGVPSGRFVIYSGGKLEHRKGQDLVLAAFKIFNQLHPNSLLITAWQNSWIESALTITQSKYIDVAPVMNEHGSIGMTEWAINNGVPADSFVDLGWVSNARLPAILRESDVALFPSRCEGGTNLVAMEAMASGIPCILSQNTGHLDLIEAGNCYALTDQLSDQADLFLQTSSIDQIVEKLELAYTDHQDRKNHADLGVVSMEKLSWDTQIEKLISKITDLL